MAEPVSFVASIITLTATLNTATKGVQTLIALKDAPGRVVDVHHKLEELKALAPIVRSTAQKSSITDPQAVSRLKLLLDRSNKTVEEAYDLIRQKLVRNPGSLDDENPKIKVKKPSFLRYDKKLQILSERLSDHIQGFQTVLNTITTTEIQGIKATVTAVSYHVTAANSYNLHYIDQRIDDRIRELSTSSDQTSDLSRPILASSSGTAPDPISSDPTNTQSLTADALSSNISHADDTNRTRPAENGSEARGHVRVDVAIEHGSIANFCSCSCHWPVSVKTPDWLANTVGRLLLRWQRNPQSCKKASCRACSHFTRKTVHVQYYLPWWMMRSIIQLESGYTASRRLAISLKTTNMIPEDSNVFLLAQHNNLDGMRKLFSSGLASPFDITPNGRTPLHFAATAVRAEMIELLVQAKAETELEDENSLSPNDIIWELFLRKPEQRRHLLTAAGLSPEHTEGLEKQCFTGVHRVVLGIGGIFSLEDYLKVSCSEIDEQDITGKTALAWAASRKDPAPVRTLLAHGASLRICDTRNKTPLHYASGSGASESVELILDAIKELENGKNPSDPSLIDAIDDKARTPLNYATRMGLYSHTKLLLDYGARIDARESKTKRCLLLNAIYWNSYKVIPLLLARGARTDYKDANGGTLLHHAARFGGLETLQILAQSRIGYIDSNIKDAKGFTAIDAFNSSSARCSPEEGATRDLAVQLFGRILGNATSGTSHGTPLVQELSHGRVEELDGSDEDTMAGLEECEEDEGTVEEITDSVAEDHNPLEDDADDADDVFFDAVAELEL